jgi:DNA repair protein RadC
MTVTDDPQGLDHPAGGADVLREAAERIADLGPAALTDVELTAILLGSAEIAQRLCGCVNIRRLHEVPDEDLAAVRGVGPSTAATSAPRPESTSSPSTSTPAIRFSGAR